MTRMQIIAKVVISALGLHLALTLLANTTTLLALSLDRTLNPVALLSFACHFLFIAAVVVVLVFRNNRPARWLAGPGRTLSPTDQHRTLIHSYRTGLLLVGLFFMPEAAETIVRFLFALSPPRLREAFNWLIYTGLLRAAQQLFTSFTWARIVKWLEAVIACYLILGAPRFVRWQLKYSIIQPTASIPEEQT